MPRVRCPGRSTRSMQKAHRRADGHVVDAGVLAAEPLGDVADRQDDVPVRVRFAAQNVIHVLDHLPARIAALDEKLLHPRIGIVEIQLADRGLAVASGASRFLVIRLDAARNFKVRDEADIGPVDPHAERVGGNGDIVAAANKFVLRQFALGVAQPAVVGDRLDAPAGQHGLHGLDPLSGRAVNDPGLVLVDERAEPLVFGGFLFDVMDA